MASIVRQFRMLNGRAFAIPTRPSPRLLKRVWWTPARGVSTGPSELLSGKESGRKPLFVTLAALSTGGLVLGSLLYPKPPVDDRIHSHGQSPEPSFTLRRQDDTAPGQEIQALGSDLELVETSKLPREQAQLTVAPEVPARLERDYPVLLEVPLTTKAKLAQLTSQYKYERWCFNGTVPGPFIRARVGDVVELNLTNKDETGNPHNIDCHAFTAPGGGAAITTAEENETKVSRFRLLHPGLYIYHCAAAPVPVHIANGMYGLMYVQPEKETLPPVDREYYVMQSEFYHEPPEIDEDNGGRPSSQVEFSYPNALREEPSIVVFNGSESALTRDKPLKASVDESVRIFFGNAGPNYTSAFHVIGSIFSQVYQDGSVVNPPARSIATICVPPGGATVADLQARVPGTYALVDHAIFRLDRGAVGFLNVSGDQNPEVCQSDLPASPCVGCKLHP